MWGRNLGEEWPRTKDSSFKPHSAGLQIDVVRFDIAHTADSLGSQASRRSWHFPASHVDRRLFLINCRKNKGPLRRHCNKPRYSKSFIPNDLRLATFECCNSGSRLEGPILSPR